MNSSEKYYPENCPAYLTGVADRYLREGLMKKFKQAECNISGEQWHILMFLYRDDGLTQKNLCQLTGKSKVSVVKAVNLLEINNLAVRIQSENDLRSKKVYLTPKGKKLEESLLALSNENLQKAFEGLSLEDIEGYKKNLRKIIANMKG